jgi:hypothetical protein
MYLFLFYTNNTNTMVNIDFNITNDKFQEQVSKVFSKFAYPKIKLVNGCDAKTKFELTPTQKFISKYFTPKNPNGVLLYHSIGSGKTLSGVSILKQFENKGYNTLWITRTTLRKDLEKATNIIPLSKKLHVYSYKQFSNICKRKGENYKALMTRTCKLNCNSNDPFYKTVIVIDEAHKLYTKDLKAQEMHDISVIQKMVYESYDKSGDKSGDNRARIVLMSATPITDNAIEAVKLLNLIITKKEDRFDVDNFKKEYLTNECLFSENGIKKFREKTKGLVSYINMARDPTKFAQTDYTNILVPVSTAPKLDIDLNYCKTEYVTCKKLKLTIKDCDRIRNKCKLRINSNKKLVKKNVYQDQGLKDKCGITF